MRGMIPGLVNPYPLVAAMPAAYQESLFTEGFLSVFDEIYAPVLTTLDNIDSYLDPLLCPVDFLPWLASWLGVELDENWSEEQQRRLLATAVELLQWRGTRRGTIELIRNFLDIEPDRIEVEDSGGVAWSVTPGGAMPGSPRPTLTVRVQATEDEIDRKRLERLVAESEPAHVFSTVEIVAPRPRPKKEAAPAAAPAEERAEPATAGHDTDVPVEQPEPEQSEPERSQPEQSGPEQPRGDSPTDVPEGDASIQGPDDDDASEGRGD
jgi:phage tail-like protein